MTSRALAREGHSSGVRTHRWRGPPWPLCVSVFGVSVCTVYAAVVALPCPLDTCAAPHATLHPPCFDAALGPPFLRSQHLCLRLIMRGCAIGCSSTVTIPATTISRAKVFKPWQQHRRGTGQGRNTAACTNSGHKLPAARSALTQVCSPSQPDWGWRRLVTPVHHTNKLHTTVIRAAAIGSPKTRIPQTATCSAHAAQPHATRPPARRRRGRGRCWPRQAAGRNALLSRRQPRIAPRTGRCR
jgi:hypothetical protein